MLGKYPAPKKVKITVSYIQTRVTGNVKRQENVNHNEEGKEIKILYIAKGKIGGNIARVTI